MTGQEFEPPYSLKGARFAVRGATTPRAGLRDPQVIHGQAGDRLIGKDYTSEELAALLNEQANILRANEGGITFSGGEPLEQAEFVAEVCDRLDNLHVVFDTSGVRDRGGTSSGGREG